MICNSCCKLRENYERIMSKIIGTVAFLGRNGNCVEPWPVIIETVNMLLQNHRKIPVCTIIESQAPLSHFTRHGSAIYHWLEGSPRFALSNSL